VALMILDDLSAWIDQSGHARRPVRRADRAGGEDGAIELLDRLAAPNGHVGGELGGELRIDRQPRGESLGEAPPHLVVEHQVLGEFGAAVGIDDLGVSVGRDHAVAAS